MIHCDLVCSSLKQKFQETILSPIYWMTLIFSFPFSSAGHDPLKWLDDPLMGLGLQSENHHPRWWACEYLGLDHKGNLTVRLFLGGTVSRWRQLGGTSYSPWISPFHQISNQCFCQGLHHWPLLAILAHIQTETMSPYSLNCPLGHLREDQSWGWGWGEQWGRRRRRGGCGFSKVSLSMVRERLEIYSKALSWLEKQQ